MAGLLAPGPTRAKAEELRAQRGSRGLLGAVGEPMAYAPNPVVAAIGQGLLGAQYLTGEKELGAGLASLSDMTAMAVGSRLQPFMRNVARAAKPYWFDPNKEPKRDQFGNVRDASRRGSAEWAGSDTPQAKTENMASDLRRTFVEDWTAKDFDPSGVRGVVQEWAAQAGIPPGPLFREVWRQVNQESALPQKAKEQIIKALLGS